MKKLIYIALLTSLFYACNKDCERYNETRNVNVIDLPAVIPYSDTSTVKFIKNGTDTLIYTSQGLKETYIDSYESNTRSGGCGTNFRLQQYSLKMKHSDNEFFEITKYVSARNGDYIKIQINNSCIYDNIFGYYEVSTSDLITFELINSIVINNIKYDSINKISLNNSNYLLAKSKIGIVKMFVNSNVYERLK